MTGSANLPSIRGRFEIREEIGKGGFGFVYRAYDAQLGRDVAIKVSRFSDEEYVRRFRQEAQLAARLNHENIVRIYDYGEDGEGRPYIVQEFLDGTTLQQHLDLLQAPNIALATRVRWLAEIASGLAHAHKNQVLHRDIKPGNVRIQSSGRAKLLDFGIAKLEYSHTNLTGAHEVLGTLEYMAPELFDRRVKDPPDAKADVWSFGVLACETLVGRKPFRAEQSAMLQFQILQGRAAVRLVREFPELPEEVLELLDGCLIVDRARRTESMQEIAVALEGAYAMIAATRSSRAMSSGSRWAKPAESMGALAIDDARLGNDSWAAREMAGASQAPAAAGLELKSATGKQGTGRVARGARATGRFLAGLEMGGLVLRMFTALGMLTAFFLVWVGASSVLQEWASRHPARPVIGAGEAPSEPARVLPSPQPTVAPSPAPGTATGIAEDEASSPREGLAGAESAAPDVVVPSDVGPGIRVGSAAAAPTQTEEPQAAVGTPVLVRVRQPLTLRVGSRVLRLQPESQFVRLPEGDIEVAWEAVDPRSGARREIRKTVRVVAGQRGQVIEAPFFTFDGVVVRIATGNPTCVWLDDRLVGAAADRVESYPLPGTYSVYVAPRDSGCLVSARRLVGEVTVAAGGGLVEVLGVASQASSAMPRVSLEAKNE